MRKKLWILLLVLVTVGIAIGVDRYFQSSPSTVSDPTPTPIATPKPTTTPSAEETHTPTLFPNAIAAPSVVSDRLMQDLMALEFDRSTETNRERSRQYIIASLQAAGWEARSQSFPEGVNIIADRPGSDRSSGTILVGAHYDTVPGSPGADDNASGVAVVLEVARLLGKQETLRSLRLAFFDREEIGLLGSFAFVTSESLTADLRAAIVLDMVGYACYLPGCQQYPDNLPIAPPSDRGDFLAVVGDREHLPLLQAFQQQQPPDVPPIYTLAVPFKGLLTPDTLRSDHAPFWSRGIGAVLVTDTANLRSPHYHRDSDTSLHIDRTFFIRSARSIVHAIALLLDSQGSLESAPPTAATSGDSID